MEEGESYIYKSESGYLFTYDEKTGRMWSLVPTEDYSIEPGKPMPESVEGFGKMTLLGVFKLDY